ncbi:acyl-CoA thioesterase [bacterium]|nr:acyl-CoA thioesterase [bacterium]
MAGAPKYYEMRHTISFEETNVVGNVYYVNHLRWQGRCRELFLRDAVPSVVEELKSGLVLVTTRCSCEYLAELNVFDEVALRMSLADLSRNRLSLAFDYWRVAGDAEELVARGEQGLACMRPQDGELRPAPWPEELAAALESYTSG